jgi:glycosyltransferase involved in cell wall biosynthesis
VAQRMGQSGPSGRPLVVLLNWRDTGHPDGGGSEVYAEHLADGLVAGGYDVTLFTARYAGSPASEIRPSGVRVVRRGGRLGVYWQAARTFRRGELGSADVLVEVQNGMPFLAAAWARRTPVVVLVHHVHREQWQVIFDPVRARLGWWLESWLAPRINRRHRYIAVSDVTRDELAALGVDYQAIRVVHNGALPPPPHDVERAPRPTLLALGRLVPHKRIEIALETVSRLRAEFPDLELIVAGRGWWDEPLRAKAAELGVGDRVRFAGFVDEQERHRLYASSWVSLVPSIKEGWGLVVVEAGLHGTPSIGFHGAGGVSESIQDGITGVLAAADDVDDFVRLTRELLLDRERRELLGKAAQAYAGGFTWAETVQGCAAVLDAARAEAASSPTRSARAVVEQRLAGLLHRRLGRGVDTVGSEDAKDRGNDRSHDDSHGTPEQSGRLI